ncbi:MAG: hypothetical protein EPN93_08880 [Spirochaetes bacterium]|nr:MAG: hypothetical protein EPN93_08880 [Spirochaetota bacterium]
MYANTGKIASLELTSGHAEEINLPAQTYASYIGGSGLAARIFFERADLSADPLAPEAMFLLMNGPLAGIKLSGASRMCAAARSPLTGTFADSSCGGYFAPAFRYAGYDGLVLTGRLEQPSLIVIEEETISIQDADFLWGRGIEECTSLIRGRYGARARSLVIGPAGENMVPFACIMHEAHHAFGRCGLGAVLGSKNVKAIVVKASPRRPVVSDPDRVASLIKTLTPRIKDFVMSQVLHEFGSAGNLEGHMYSGDVPVRNWTSNFDEEMAEALTGSTLSDKYLTRAGTCAYCAVACKRIVKVDDGPFTIPEGPGPEYETVAAFGSLMGSSDLAAACKANRVCNDLGMDTISAGATIAWAMEAFERGQITPEHTRGVPLEWGDMRTVIDTLLPAMARREEGAGALLARGSAAAARLVGGNSIDYTAQGKGLESPMHDPRGGGHGHALAYAVSPRGACHVSTAMHFMETGACNYPEIGFEFNLEALTAEGKPETMMLAAAIGSIENSACLCQYADRTFTIPEMVELFNAAAGYGYDARTMLDAGYRVFHLKRVINCLLGFTAADDALTPRMLEPARDGDPAGIEIRFDEMKADFYALMGMDPEKGVARTATLRALGMDAEARAVWPGNS